MRQPDKVLLKVLRRTTLDNPADLSMIIGAIDALEGMIIPYKKLEAGIQRLIEAEKIQQVSPLHFCKADEIQQKSAFSGITREDYEEACRHYHAEFKRLLEDLESKPDDNIRQLMACRLAFVKAGDLSDNAEETAELLAEKIEAVLPNIAEADINGFEYSADHIDILIFGAGTDNDIDQIYQIIAPVFRVFPAEPGSCIIRYYDNSQSGFRSDIVR